MPLTSSTQIVNQALRHLGDESVLGLDDTTRRAEFVEQYYPTALDYVLGEHPWNFAMKRATLLAYTTPSQSLTLASTSGDAVVVDATGVIFDADTDIGKVIKETEGSGVGTIVNVNLDTQVLVDITADFSATGIAAGAWRLYNPTPTYGFTYSLSVPGDWLRGWRDDHQSGPWQKEGDYVVSNTESMNIRYISRVEDVEKFPAQFVRALVAYLTASIAEGITGQGSKYQQWMQTYQMEIKNARTRDGQEGTPERVRSDTLIRVRWGGA